MIDVCAGRSLPLAAWYRDANSRSSCWPAGVTEQGLHFLLPLREGFRRRHSSSLSKRDGRIAGSRQGCLTELWTYHHARGEVAVSETIAIESILGRHSRAATPVPVGERSTSALAKTQRFLLWCDGS
jgi:hypothetical protein